MKTKILFLTMTALAAAALAGCERPATENSTPAANPPGDSQAASPTNLSGAGNPAMPAGSNDTNGPAVTNRPGTINPTATNQ